MPPAPDDADAADPMRARVRAVLLTDWDPHDAARSPAAAAGTYDTYVDPVRRLLAGGADEQALVDYLHERERESMCFPSLGTARLRRVARKLLALRDGGD